MGERREGGKHLLWGTPCEPSARAGEHDSFPPPLALSVTPGRVFLHPQGSPAHSPCTSSPPPHPRAQEMDTHTQRPEKGAPLPGPVLVPVWRQVAGLGRLRGWACLAKPGWAEGLPRLQTPSSRSGNTCGRLGGFCCHDSGEDPAAGQGDRPGQGPSVPVSSARRARASQNSGCRAQQPLE